MTFEATQRPSDARGTEPRAVAPRLAPDVELVGRQRDTGFQEEQWLVQRDGRFLQVSDLLYRILERLDGRRSLESVAAGVTEVMPWVVTADNVQHLVDTKLIPAGLVAAPEDSPGLHRSSSGRSPLAVNARRVLIGPRALERITGAVQLFFYPPLLLPILAWVVFGHVWLYVDHGIGGGLRDVLVHPALILATTLIFVATMAFHELGHASALRYGGGHARGIGVGFYLIYPVFFTDTTDAYRLGRWARVRVDLGGFYFQLIAAVALMGLSLALGQEWLLVPVLLITIEVVRQLLFPFVRLDGYWLVADLTGIPDFFSHAGPFVKSLLPGGLRKRGGIPALKRSTRAVFATYLVATVPVLGFLFFQMATNMPHFISIAWHSFVAQKGSFAHAVASGDIAQAAGSLGQMLILSVPAISSAILSLIVTVWLASVMWRRRRTVPARAARATG